MDQDFFAHIKQKLLEKRYTVTFHAYEEADEEEIEMALVRKVVIAGELIEDYPNDRRGHSCLILGWIDEKPIHVVCGMREGEAVFITIYSPDPAKWINSRVRRRRT